MPLTAEQEEIRETIWQKHKDEEYQLIREIENAQRILNDLQSKYHVFEKRVTAEVVAALDTPTITIKIKCPLCQKGHSKRACPLFQKKIETISSK
jgi:hypothetical protein